MISADGLALKLGITLPEAQDLLAHHRRVFSKFWAWSDAALDCYQLYGELRAVAGWTLHLSEKATMRSLRNFPMQANGSEMLRVASVLATAANVGIVALVHDALLIEADEREITQASYTAQKAMRRASEIVLSGFSLRTEAKIFKSGERFEDGRGAEMWRWMMQALGQQAV